MTNTPPSPTPTLEEDLGKIRKSCHDTYNGGWNEEKTNKAFHHGINTAFSVIEESLLTLLPIHHTQSLQRIQELEGALEKVKSEIPTLWGDCEKDGVVQVGMESETIQIIESLLQKHTS